MQKGEKLEVDHKKAFKFNFGVYGSHAEKNSMPRATLQIVKPLILWRDKRVIQ